MQTPEGRIREADLYSLLALGPEATTDEIQKSYKTLSKTFHPDRLRARHPGFSELAQETFVKIKAAHDVLCDPVYRFAYDQYGHEGVSYIRQCQQVKESQQKAQQLLLPMDIHLYSKLQTILQGGESEIQMLAAIKLFKDVMERYKRQVKLAKQRLQGASFTFDATIELPCAHHPQGANVALESDRIIPYLELEEAHIDVSVRTTNRRQTQSPFSDEHEQSSKPQQPQRHIYAATAGMATEWEATGKGGANLSLSTDYQMTPTSKTTWNVEVSSPITKLPKKRSMPAQRPVKLQVSTTHEFVSGTVMNVGVRGSNVSLNSWEYFVTSFRKLSIGWLDDPSEPPRPNMLAHNVRGSFAMGMKMFTGQPLFGFATMTTIPTQKPPEQQPKPHQNDGNGNATAKSTPLELSTPELSIRAGYHPKPIHASIKYKEFGKPWASMSSSWSWSIANASSSISLMLSADLWGFFEDNDTTTVKTGIKHDLESGWIWLWVWEEADFTMKVPISLTISKNTAWVAAAMGTQVMTSDILHSSLGSLIASYFVMRVARSLASDWTSAIQGHSSGKSGKGGRQPDATFQEDDEPRDSFQLDNDNDDAPAGTDTKLSKTFQSLTSKIAENKRALEKTNGGLVLRFATLEVVPSTTANTATSSYDLTDNLQFWVKHGKLSLPPVSSQSAPHFYALGGNSWRSEDAKNKKSSWSMASTSLSSLRRVSDDCVQYATQLLHNHALVTADRLKQQQQQQQQDTSTSSLASVSSCTYKLKVRYELEGKLYDLTLGGNEDIVLPNNGRALLLGNADTLS